MSTWTVEATIRTTGRVGESAVRALSATGASWDCAARSCGTQGLVVHLHVQASAQAAAGGAALAVLADQVLPVLEGASLVDLRVTAGRTDGPGRPPLVAPVGTGTEKRCPQAELR